MKPLVVINLKTYKQGYSVLRLAKTIENVDKNIIIGAQDTDIYLLSSKTKLKVYAQHVDPQYPGRNTGFLLPEAVKKMGAVGTFLNHSEHRIPTKTIKETIIHCKKTKLKTMVFAPNINEARKLERLNPDFLVIEPPELVAGKISVSEAKPELIKGIKKAIKTPFLVGAGIHTSNDIKTALKLGAVGVALSSYITKAKNPGKALKILLA